MLLIDKIIWGFLAIFFLSGWLRGFLRSLVGPIAFIFCFLSAVIFYDLNRNILMAAVITFAGTIALALGLSLLLAITLASINKELRGKVFLLSRILGAAVNVSWQANILFIGLIIFSICPTEQTTLTRLQSEVSESTMVAFYKSKIVSKSNEYQALIASLQSIRDPNEIKIIMQTKEFKDFQADPKLQAFANDPDVITALEEKDMIKILKAPTLRKLVTNDGSMYTFTRLTEMVYNNKLDQITQKEDPQPEK
jgi:hypothetical protein